MRLEYLTRKKGHRTSRNIGSVCRNFIYFNRQTANSFRNKQFSIGRQVNTNNWYLDFSRGGEFKFPAIANSFGYKDISTAMGFKEGAKFNLIEVKPDLFKIERCEEDKNRNTRANIARKPVGRPRLNNQRDGNGKNPISNKTGRDKKVKEIHVNIS